MATGNGATSYADCVTCLRSSLGFLESSVQTLDNGVSDFPRLCNVLKSVRVCPPLSIPTVSSSRVVTFYGPSPFLVIFSPQFPSCLPVNKILTGSR